MGVGVRGWGYLFYELREQDGRDRFKYFSYLFEKKSSVYEYRKSLTLKVFFLLYIVVNGQRKV